MQNIDWFHGLTSPPLSPPDWVFAPVWAILYIMLGLSFLIFIKDGLTKSKKIALVFFIIQLFLNFSWSPVFFGMRNIFSALLILIFMWFFTLITLSLFLKHSKPAGTLLIPYFIWLMFALYLNFGYFLLN